MTTPTPAPMITMERRFDASPEAVWRAWTDPTVMITWYCPNPQWDVTAETDPRVGGVWRVRMGPHAVSGAYTAVEPPHRLAFTWQWDSHSTQQSHVVVQLESDGAGTLLRLTHTDLTNDDDAKGHAEGWQLSFDRLTPALASRA